MEKEPCFYEQIRSQIHKRIVSFISRHFDVADRRSSSSRHSSGDFRCKLMLAVKTATRWAPPISTRSGCSYHERIETVPPVSRILYHVSQGCQFPRSNADPRTKRPSARRNMTNILPTDRLGHRWCVSASAPISGPVQQRDVDVKTRLGALLST